LIKGHCLSHTHTQTQTQTQTHTHRHTHTHSLTWPSSSLRSEVLTCAFWSLSSWYRSKSQPMKNEPRNFCISTVTYSDIGMMKLYNTRNARKSEMNFRI